MNVFKKKSFRILCCATAISSLGDSLYSLACTLTVYAMSGSILGVAGMWLIRALIRIPSQFVSGVVADKCNRKKVSVIIYLISAFLVCLFLCVNEANLVLAFILIFILQGTSDVDNMAQAAILPELLEKEELQSANSIFHIIGTVIMLTGPGIGGILYKLFGSQILYIIDAITFLLAAGIMLALPYRRRAEEKKEIKFTLFAFAKEGLTEIKKHSLIKAMTITTIFFGILGRFYEIDKVYLADTVLHIGAEGIVFFSYAMSIGSLLAPVVLKLLDRKELSPVKVYAFLSIFTIICFVLWGVSTSLIICLLANLFLGIFNTGTSIYVNIIFQKNVENQCFGRVMSFYKICMVLSAVLGVLLAPVLVETLGVGGSMVSFGIIAVLGVLVTLYFGNKKEKI